MTRFLSLLLSFFFTVCAALLPGRVYLPPLDESGEVCRCGAFTLVYDTSCGTFSVAKNSVTLFADAFCEYVRDGTAVSSRAYSVFEASQSGSGDARTLTVRMRGEGLWDLTQTFSFAEGRDWFTTRVTLHSPEGVATNAVSPLVIADGKLQNMRYRWSHVLEVPYDNDGWVQFAIKNTGEETASYEVGALFTPDDGGGLVLGSLEHGLWKSAVFTGGSRHTVRDLHLICGAVDPRQGTEPHGTVSGESVSSALAFIGVFGNWKEGMNAYARANTEVTPKRTAVTDQVPFGWNSWGSVQTALSHEIAVGTSDYFKEVLQPAWGEGKTVYINLDSYWDNLSAEQLRDFVDHCHRNGQKVGLYTGPFVMWWDDYGMSVSHVPGTDNALTYQDIRLKKRDGTYYGNELDGCVPLDVTHPGTKLHVRHVVDRIKAAGAD